MDLKTIFFNGLKLAETCCPFQNFPIPRECKKTKKQKPNKQQNKGFVKRCVCILTLFWAANTVYHARYSNLKAPQNKQLWVSPLEVTTMREFTHFFTKFGGEGD